jgi:hypothetical protein
VLGADAIAPFHACPWLEQGINDQRKTAPISQLNGLF